MNKRKMPLQKDSYYTFEIRGQTIIIDDFIYRRLFKDPDIPPRRKYTFINGINISTGYPRIVLKSNDKAISLSRYIMHAVKGDFVDHINRNPLDNRRCNLRIVNARHNVLNRKVKNNTGLIGVSACIENGKFYVSATYGINKGKNLRFHCPDTPFNRILATLAHDKFVLQEGEEEYAPLNFPCFKFEPLRSILLKEDLGKYKERSKDVRKQEARKKTKLNQQILRFCRKMAIRNISQNKKLDKK